MLPIVSTFIAFLFLLIPPLTFANSLEVTRVQNASNGNKIEEVPPWEGSLFCSTAETPGILWFDVICGKTLPACERNLDKQREIINALLKYTASYTDCNSPQPEMMPVYCFGFEEEICSRKELFCEVLHRRSALPVMLKGRSCIRYSMPRLSSE